MASPIFAEDISATGDDEQLTAKLKPSLFVGGKLGIHWTLAGLEGGALFTMRKLEVRNASGVQFPNHGENIIMAKTDFLLYPLGLFLAEGRFRAYGSVGFGGALSSIDLRNHGDQVVFIRPMISGGLGAKYQLRGKDRAVHVEAVFRNEHVFGRVPIRTSDFRMLSVGVVFKQ